MYMGLTTFNHGSRKEMNIRLSYFILLLIIGPHHCVRYAYITGQHSENRVRVRNQPNFSHSVLAFYLTTQYFFTGPFRNVLKPFKVQPFKVHPPPNYAS